MADTMTEYKGVKGTKVRRGPKAKARAVRVKEHPYAHLPMLTHADVPDTVLMNTLFKAVSIRRAHGSMAEAAFVAWLCNRLPVTMIDASGNIHVDTRTGPMHRTMFTSHTDTVHSGGGVNPVHLDTTDPLSIKWRASKGSCLGADDGAGIALMLHMLDAGVPGYYIFFRNEERGGTGSRWLSEKMPRLMEDLDRCISFDRADYSDVITHQGYGRCCSDTFALALADALTPMDMSIGFVPCDTGVFTDSANLVDNIGECTNLSVGYKYQHGDGEWQDVTFLQKLADVLVTVAWDELPVERNPGDEESHMGDLQMEPLKSIQGHLSPSVSTSITAAWVMQGKGAELHAAMREYVEDDRAHALKLEVALWICPNGPASVLKFVDVRQITKSKYAQHMDQLERGDTTAMTLLQVLEDKLLVA